MSGLNMDNFLGSRPQDQMRALANMCRIAGVAEMYRRAADQLETLNTVPPDIMLPPIALPNPASAASSALLPLSIKESESAARVGDSMMGAAKT